MIDDRLFDAYRSTLEDLVRIPSVSDAHEEVQRSAQAFADVLRAERIGDVQVIESAVYGLRFLDKDKPTVLVYGHHDVQPPGRLDAWLSPPFEPDIRDGRMYGRGTSDDKGGVLAWLAATHVSRDCNVKFLIEGEEEIGSPSLGRFIDEHRELLAADFVVLCDTPNFATGVPSLTYRLRGNFVVDVEVRCLERPAHSGKFGGLVPDAVQILCAMLSRLTLPDIGDESIDLPFDEAAFRRDLGVLDSVALPEEPFTRMWARPSITVTGIESRAVAQAGNQINESARARISIRSVRGDEPELLLAQLAEPVNAEVTTRVVSRVDPWKADRTHPLYAAARRAMEQGFGKPAVMTGSGGSIGFVPPFAKLAGDRPPLLTGVQDPPCNAHSENESLHLGDWRSAMRAGVFLFDELRRFAS
jgi:acetylornithine deacetylase/succinyl-diaminopimelate desuccinylase-like protein